MATLTSTPSFRIGLSELSFSSSHGGRRSSAPTALIFQRPVAASSSTVLPMIFSNSSISSCERLKLSVESNHSVTTLTWASSHQPKKSMILFAPALWPWGSLSVGLDLAQRRFPSRMTPTCCGVFEKSKDLIKRHSYSG
jgi:hypothetical protein